jgi:hypothetical protein
MSITTIIACPICGSDGAMLHHDCRAPLVYFCETCMHEWHIGAAAEEIPHTDPTVDEPPPTVAVGGKRAHKR